MRTLLFALPLLVVLAGPATARADCADIDPQPFAGTIGYRAGVLTRTSFGSAFGVASFLESRILPDLSRGISTASFQGAAIANASRVPTIRPGCDVLGDVYERLPSMQYSVNVGFGAKLKYGFEVFYGGNVTESIIASDDFAEGFVGHLTLLKGFGTGMLAPIMMLATDEEVSGPQASYYDFVAGAGWGSPYGSIRGGFVGSTGVFLNVGSYKVGVNGSAVFDFDDALISYLKGGLGPYATPLGLTELFARGSLLSSGPRVSPVTGREIEGAVATEEWVTVHLQQQLADSGWGLGPDALKGPVWADLEVAVTVRPDVELHTIRGKYIGDLLYASAGLTQPPDLWAIGGERKLRLSLGAGMNIFVSRLEGKATASER
ncbi:hypothetical protein L6R52_36160, partial [Myxococcota bacterium]|nr:hypothetical protein [Myxococcota bacterium]